ncbi:hypothetical protein [Petroclostridium xylanilyticum]|jgi:hypothetical protein|uniref:hypothetical protein n=1 Tax=Petroclostridium xylanilyticum TaxID=1792311 RepID=UPI000B98B6BF|nr:hypothetical protein [Petroclostridium xylanilyticum]
MIDHYKRIIKDSEKRAAFFLKNQILDKNSFDYGAVVKERNYVEPKSTIYGITTLLALYYNEESSYYRKPDVYERINIALDYVRRAQRPDGTFDLLDCNFYSAPDTAFCVRRLAPSYKLLGKYGKDEKSEVIREKIYNIIKDAAYGMTKGGFHTPNHRWAIASTLMASYNIVGENEFKEVALRYLSEGIDGNEYGEYAERSAGGYNIINNSAMIMLAEESGDESYLEYVDRNLKMMFTYFDPDGSVFTNNSTRQDRGQKVYPRDYYYQYVYMAYKTSNKEFAAAANKIMDDVIERGGKAPDCLDLFMIHPEFIEFELQGSAFPDNYKKYYKDSGIVRVRKNDISFSIIENNSRFLYFQAGALTAYMKIGVSYFDQREFKIQKLEETDQGYILNYRAQGWYYKPFNEKPDTTDWWKMDHSKREKIYGPNLDIIVKVQEVEDGIEVNIATQGCDRVPLRIEMGFTSGTLVKSDGFMCEGVAGGAIAVKSGNIEVSKDMDTIMVGPAFANHMFIGGKFGSEARSRDHFTIYFTDFTNFDHTITLKKK